MGPLARWFLPAAAVLGFSGCSGPQPAAQKPAQPPPPAKIVMFYASPGIVPKGEAVTLCYGVEQATAVRLDPPVEAIAPAANRCIQFSPAVTKTYTLTAAGAGGAEVTQSLEIRVGAPEPRKTARTTAAANRLIETFAASSESAPAGQPVTLCYVVRAGATVKLEPGNPALPAGAKNCTVVRPTSTVTYTLSASAEGQTDKETLTIRVK